MAFTTGSGSFNDLLTAIVQHAIADGWSEVNGFGTGFPISIGNTVVDLQTYIQQDNNVTLGLAGGPFDAVYGALGLGVDGTAASNNAALGDGAASRIPNASFVITNYYIFSDPASGTNYVNVCFEFTNGVDPRVFQHFSFGEIDRQGMTYTGISYTASGYRRGYALTGGEGANAQDWNSINRGSFPFAGRVGEADDGSTETSFLIHGTSPVDSANGYPAAGVLTTRGASLWDSTRIGGDFIASMRNTVNSGNGDGYKPGWTGMQITSNMPFTGAISMQVLPFILSNLGGEAGAITWCGVFPDVRQCNMVNYAPGDEVSFGADTWQIFPWTRQTSESLLNQPNIVTSGPAALAYRKVV